MGREKFTGRHNKKTLSAGSPEGYLDRYRDEEVRWVQRSNALMTATKDEDRSHIYIVRIRIHPYRRN